MTRKIRGALADLVESTMDPDVARGILSALRDWWTHDAPAVVEDALRDIGRETSRALVSASIASDLRAGARCARCLATFHGDDSVSSRVGRHVTITLCRGCYHGGHAEEDGDA